MNIVQITPGAGAMLCGGCFRDNALVAALRRLGHDTLMVPLYLPLTLDEADQSAGTPIFFGGINVYLEQQAGLFRHLPGWLHRFLAHPRLLKWASGRAAKTRPQDVGELTLSMIRGEEGNQARELEELIGWLKQQVRPDAICLSNVLLAGFVRRLKAELGVPVVCTLHGEDTFLDALPLGLREQVWSIVIERARDVDRFIAPSHYFGDLMARRLQMPREKLHVLYNGISLEGYPPPRPDSASPVDPRTGPPVIGFFARMCREKGLELVVDAYLALRRRNRVPRVRLKIGGGCGPSDERVVAELQPRLAAAGALGDVEFHRNVDRAGKVAFLRSLDVFCTPALYGEAFGLYVIEALAAGVPVVQPRLAAFPEIVAATGGGLIAEPTPEALAESLETLLLDPVRARALGDAGQRAVFERFTIERLARETVEVLELAGAGGRDALRASVEKPVT